MLYITVSIPIRGGQISNKFRLQSLNPTQHWSCWRPWGHPTQVQGSQKVDLPLPAQGSGPWKDVTPQLAQGSASPGVTGGGHTSTCPGTEFLGGQHALTCLGIRSPGGCHASTCLGNLHPDPGTPGSQVATVLGRISFRKTHP